MLATRLENESLASWLASQPEKTRSKLLADLSDKELQALEYDWKFWARPKQLAPSGNWRIWLILAGRGFGKSRSGSEWIRHQVETEQAGRVAMVARTTSDARDVLVEDMQKGANSGLMQVCPPWFKPKYEPSKRRLTWPNGATATLYSADEPDRLRGPQHDAAWADELAAWKYEDAWTQLMFGLRLGENPRCVVTTTPRPTKIIKNLVARAGRDVALVTGTTYENKANLAPAFFEEIIREYEGTRLGRQELLAEILDEFEGALWTHGLIESLRVTVVPAMSRIVVAIDPAVSTSETSNETGILVCGLGNDGHGYVLEDLSGKYSPNEWATIAVKAFHTWQADRIIGEVNNGGDLVESNIRTVGPNVPYKAVRASRGKRIRAEPVAALYEQGRVHHLHLLPALEDQMCTWNPETDESPDRMDALVWGLWELMVKGKKRAGAL